jgi:myosin-5
MDTGKYVELLFNEQGSLKGAAVRTYLLERSRVVHVATGERSFHAFYQVRP